MCSLVTVIRLNPQAVISCAKLLFYFNNVFKKYFFLDPWPDLVRISFKVFKLSCRLTNKQANRTEDKASLTKGILKVHHFNCYLFLPSFIISIHFWAVELMLSCRHSSSRQQVLPLYGVLSVWKQRIVGDSNQRALRNTRMTRSLLVRVVIGHQKCVFISWTNNWSWLIYWSS